MLEVATNAIQTLPLVHHALVSAVCKDLRIAERVDACLCAHKERIVSPGQDVVALILNGLGFTNQSTFVSDTPVFQVINIPHGHSKDHRPDLKQAVFSLVVNGPAGIPI